MSSANGELGHWATVKGEGGPGVAMFRLRMDRPADAAAHPINVTVGWRYRGGPGGMPRPLESQAMGSFEDAIASLTHCPGLSYLVLVATGFDLREWHFYATDYGKFLKRLNELLETHPPLTIEVQHTEDPDWQLWREVREKATQAQ